MQATTRTRVEPARSSMLLVSERSHFSSRRLSDAGPRDSREREQELERLAEAELAVEAAVEEIEQLEEWGLDEDAPQTTEPLGFGTEPRVNMALRERRCCAWTWDEGLTANACKATKVGAWIACGHGVPWLGTGLAIHNGRCSEFPQCDGVTL